MIGSIGSLMPFLTIPNSCEEIFTDGKDHVIAASGSSPVGRAERASGGWPDRTAPARSRIG